MKQRVCIAMALSLRPPLILLDEPTSALDVLMQAQITNLLKELKQEYKTSFIFITHDIALASDICDLFAVIYGGTAEQVLVSPAHPYTRKLLSCLPRLRSAQGPEFIPGTSPDLRTPLGAALIPWKFAAKNSPPSQVKNGHWTSCWLYNQSIP